MDDIEYRFLLRGRGPQPLAVDGREIGHGLPRRPIPLTELSAVLMHPSCSYAARDTVWRLLARRARNGEAAWRAEAVGVALPGLRYKAHLLAKLSRGDVQASLVEHFLRALDTADLDQPGVIGRLLATAFTAARRELREAEPAASGQGRVAAGSAVPPAPYGHPDLLLARAVRAGVLTVDEAELIGATYLEDVTLTEYAARTGQSRWALYKRRGPAVEGLVAALLAGVLSDPDAEVIAEATLTTAPEPRSRRERP